MTTIIELEGGRKKSIPINEIASAIRESRLDRMKADMAKSEGGKIWFEVARSYFRLFGNQHPIYGINKAMERALSSFVWSKIGRGNCRNYRTFAFVNVVPHVHNVWRSGRGFSWITDRLLHYFSAYNPRTSTLYVEYLNGGTLTHPGPIKWEKFNCYREVMKKGTDFFAWFGAIQLEQNSERQREMIERVGEETYLRKLEGGIISKDVDGAGKERLLIEVENYSVATPHLRILRVIDSSTDRVYYLIPINQKTNNVEEAWRSMFPQDISYRHGDVGLSLINSSTQYALQES